MVTVATRAGISIAVIFGVLAVFQVPWLTYPLLIFMAAGVIPGTNLAIPPDLMLLVVGGLLMAITLLLYRQYTNYRLTLQSLLPQYQDYYHGDPSFEELLPGLDGAKEAGRSLLEKANELSFAFYFWFKTSKRPLMAQAIAAHEGLHATFVRIDRWALSKVRQLENLEYVKLWLKEWVERVKSYLVRLTLM